MKHVFQTLFFAVLMMGQISAWATPGNASAAVDSCDYFQGGFGYQVNGYAVTFNDQSSATPNYVFWDFGDGNTGAGDPVTHYYANPGLYWVCQTSIKTYANGDSCVKVSCRKVFVQDSCEVFAADFTYQSNPGGLGLSITAQDNSTYPASAVEWTWGDGTTSTGSPATHTFPTSGTYNVCIRAYLYLVGDTCVDTRCRKVVVSGNQRLGLEARNLEWEVYPNPTTEFIMISPSENSQESVKISLYDISGRLLRKLPEGATTLQKHSVADLEAGVYFLKMETPAGSSIEKFVKE